MELLALFCVLCLCGSGIAQLATEASLSCAGKCHHAYNRTLQCECNDQCDSHGNCCHDYHTLCTTGNVGVVQAAVTCSMQMNDVTEELWRSDVNRLDPSMYTLNLQANVPSTNNADQSPAPFFTRVDQNAINSRPTWQAFLALQNNYNPSEGQHDSLTSSQVISEMNTFLDDILRTPVMTNLLTYLQCRNLVVDQNDLRVQLRELWFTAYPRHAGGPVDTSGFEHVMVGEYKGSNVVNGLHNWLAFYAKERAHVINYYGYVRQASPNLVAVNYDWNGHHKALGTFFVGTSPEFDMALFTLCALTHTTTVRLGGHDVHIGTFILPSPGGAQIATAYPSM